MNNLNRLVISISISSLIGWSGLAVADSNTNTAQLAAAQATALSGTTALSDTSAALGNTSTTLSAAQIRQQVEQVNAAQNQMMRQGSVPADIAALFALYSAGFSYLHPQYGGTYSRAELEQNSLRNQAAGRFNLTQDRYQIRQILTGHNAAAVERLELASGQTHLTVFEFSGDKVSRIIEYWQ